MEEYDQDPEVDAAEPQGRPAAPGSALASLRDRRAQGLKKLFVDLPVPRYDPPIYVRFKPMAAARITAISKRFEKSKDPDKDVLANAVTLAEACIGIFQLDAGGAEVSVDVEHPNDDWPRFDTTLGGMLGIEVAQAVEAVRGLYLTDGDVIATAGKLTEWSGYTVDELEERVQGN